MELIKIRHLIQSAEITYKIAKDNLKNTQSRVNETEQETIYLEESRAVIQSAAQKTQQYLEQHITNIVSLALRTVFEDPYEFKVQFVVRRNSTECDLFLTQNGKDYLPLESCGYGVADVCSFALRIAYWRLQHPNRNTIILDEPFRFCDKTKHPLLAQMLRELSDSLRLQFIIVTHEEGISEGADKLFQVHQKNNTSYIKYEAP